MKLLKDTMQFMKSNMPNVFIKCTECEETIFKKHLDDNFYVCPKCDYHFRINADQRINYTLDKYSFFELDKNIYPVDALNFNDKKPYSERLLEAQKKSGRPDGFVYGYGKIGGKNIVFGVLDFYFMGGSMGVVVGEKITRAFERAAAESLPLIIASCSGGARMQEGVYSLMQLVKTIEGVSKLDKAKKPFISILADPTMAGVAASYSTLGDINIAEPKAIVGFAGKRVVQQATRGDLPKDFQTSEFFVEHGGIDMIVHRKDMKETLEKILQHF